MSRAQKPTLREAAPLPDGIADGAGLYELAFHHSPSMQSVVRASDGILVEVNATFLKKFGFTREQVIGKTADALNFWVEPDSLAEYRRELSSQGWVEGFEVRLRASTGDVVTVLLSSHPVHIGGALHYLSAGVDITARKRAEAALSVSNERLRQTEERFSKVFRSSPALVAITRFRDGVYVAANEAYLRTIGFSEEELVGHTSADLDLHVALDQREEFLRLVREHGSARDCEFVVRAKDGRFRTLLVSGELIDIDGESHLQTVGLDITQRKEDEARLRESERRYRESEARLRTVFRASPMAVSLGRLSDGVFVAVNEAFSRVTGYAEQDVLGRSSHELNLYAQPDSREQFFKEIQTRGYVRDFEYLLRPRNGGVRTMVLSAELVEVDGAPHVLVVASDITARKEAEEQLRESERRFRESEARFSSAFHASPLMMTVARLPDSKFVEVNEAFVRLLGLRRDEIIGRDSSELGMWVNLEARAKFYARLQQDRLVRNVEAEIRRPDGAIHTMMISGEVIEINQEPHLLTFALDVTDQKRAEQVMRESEARARALYESITAAVVVQDETGFLQINSASLKLFSARRPEELLGHDLAQFSAAQQPDGELSRRAAERHVARALAEGTHRFDWTARKLNGEEFPVEVTLTALQLAGRTVVQSVIIDLSERKRAEAELQNALAKERELSQLKSDFVSLVSHEFRTPLEVIMSSSDNLQRYHERLTKEKRDHLLGTIHKSVRRMADMMEEVLVLGRVESGKTEFKPVAFDLHLFCQRTADEILTATGRRCPLNVVPLAAPVDAFGDENLLRHILSNLLSNAIKYSPPNESVTLAVTQDGANALFEVSDHGCGIPVADQKRLFKAFHRAGNVRQISGTGLGLVIVERCVALHGGSIRFASVEGQGTTFTVTLPLFTEQRELPEVPGILPDPPAEAGNAE